MWEVVDRLLLFFTPPSLPVSELFGAESTMATREKHIARLRTYHRRVSYTLMGLLCLVIIALFTPWGIVRSSDLAEKVEAAVKSSELAKSVEQIKVEQQTTKVELASVKATLSSMTPVLNELYKVATAQTICSLLNNKLREAADKEQDKYKTIAGEYYPESRCGGK